VQQRSVAGVQVRALVRRAETASALTGCGVELVIGDHEQPEGLVNSVGPLASPPQHHFASRRTTGQEPGFIGHAETVTSHRP
jgi:hypothetical protein